MPNNETDKERINRELIELLNELKVALPGVQVLFAAEFEQLDAVVRADLVSEVVEEFEHREGLLRRPIGRDCAATSRTGRGCHRARGSQ